jgi:small subunit ribosomal protein S13
MARIAGIDLPVQKRVEIGLTYIRGVGRARAQRLCRDLNIDTAKKVKDLTEDEVQHLQRKLQDEGQIEGDLIKNVRTDIARLVEIGSYRGQRHRKGLPVRGQRTHTNARTRKGPRQTVGGVSSKKQEE